MWRACFGETRHEALRRRDEEGRHLGVRAALVVDGALHEAPRAVGLVDQFPQVAVGALVPVVPRAHGLADAVGDLLEAVARLQESETTEAERVAAKQLGLVHKLALLVLKRRRRPLALVPEKTAAALWRVIVANTDELYVAAGAI